MEKTEPKMQCYYFKVLTFRRTLELRVGGTKEEFDKDFGELGYEYNLTSGFYMFDEKNNCNIIRLRDYNLYSLVHELEHCVIGMCEQCGMPIEGEPPAYIYEELFSKIRCKVGYKFKGDKTTEKYFKEE